MAETPAAAKVLHTPELLETILLQLIDTSKGWTDLLLSQRVCQTFKATIGSSPSLQETLHFRVSCASLDEHASNRYNKEVLSKIFEPACQKDGGRSILETFLETFDAHRGYNTYVRPLHPTTQDSHGIRGVSVIAKQLTGSDVEEVLPMKPASWRRMVLLSTQAQIKTLCSHTTLNFCYTGMLWDSSCFCYDTECSSHHWVDVTGGIQDGETVEGLLRRLWPDRWL
ncbi:hypothetical protein LTR17_000925 [Elasticomyces elasticus]|nr:hypothetical protein LTR17_000925 [Elasticomyces elasticus]